MAKTHHIDCAAFPSVPEKWSVMEHLSFGDFNWKGRAFPKTLLLTVPGQSPWAATGAEILKRLRGVNAPVYNANVLDYLLQHRSCIPRKWSHRLSKPKDFDYQGGIYFWGTIYRDSDGMRRVRCLTRNNEGELVSDSMRVDPDGLTGFDPAAMHGWFKIPDADPVEE